MKTSDFASAYGAPGAEFHNNLCRTLNTLPEAAPAPAPRLRVRRFAVMACAACLLLGVTAFAAGQIAGSVGHSNWKEAVYTVEQAESLTQKYGINAQLPQSFKNGYVFKDAIPGVWQNLDEDGNVMGGTGHDVSIDYAQGQKRVSLIVDTEETNAAEQGTTEYNGVTIYTKSCRNVTVPENYELTDEEKAAEERGEVMFGVDGSTERRECMSHFAWWRQGDVSYMLLASSDDSPLSADDLAAMAQELIDANK